MNTNPLGPLAVVLIVASLFWGALALAGVLWGWG